MTVSPLQRAPYGRAARVALVAVGASVVLAACTSTSYADGMSMIDESVSGLTAILSPSPQLPAADAFTNSGSCEGLDGRSHGTVKISKVYHLGVVPLATSEAWLDQANRFMTDKEFTGLGVNVPSTPNGKIASGKDSDNEVHLGLERSGADGSVQIFVSSPCVSES